MDEYFHTKLFPLSLKGEALQWFAKLPHGSIENFGKLKSSFHSFYKIYILVIKIILFYY